MPKVTLELMADLSSDITFQVISELRYELIATNHKAILFAPIEK